MLPLIQPAPYPSEAYIKFAPAYSHHWVCSCLHRASRQTIPPMASTPTYWILPYSRMLTYLVAELPSSNLVSQLKSSPLLQSAGADVDSISLFWYFSLDTRISIASCLDYFCYQLKFWARIPFLCDFNGCCRHTGTWRQVWKRYLQGKALLRSIAKWIRVLFCQLYPQVSLG